MNELIKVNYDSDNITVSARELHEFLEVKTEYKDWFPRMCEYGFVEGVDFRSFLSKSTGGRPAHDAEITLDMAKELCMIQRNAKGKQARQYFIQLEKDWNSPEKVMARALQIADQKIKQLTAKIELDAPKVEFYDAVTDSKTAIPMGEVAKVLNYKGYGRNNLFEFLRDKKILMQNNMPYQKYIDCEYFRVIEQKYTKPDGEIAISIKTLVYQKGVDYIKKLLDGETIKVDTERKLLKCKYKWYVVLYLADWLSKRDDDYEFASYWWDETQLKAHIKVKIIKAIDEDNVEHHISKDNNSCGGRWFSVKHCFEFETKKQAQEYAKSLEWENIKKYYGVI